MEQHLGGSLFFVPFEFPQLSPSNKNSPTRGALIERVKVRGNPRLKLQPNVKFL